MKQSDFDRLKAACEKEGFELLTKDSIHWMGVDYIALSDKKKDIWEGVEFVEYLGDGSDVRKGFTKGKIYKVREFKDYVENLGVVIDDNESTTNGYAHKFFKPSTEQAYIEQKKAEVFKRFGEIKAGDKFDRSWAYEHWPNHTIIDNTKRGFYYEKDYDRFGFNGSCLYEKGKWATRVPERVKVKFNYHAIYQEKQPCESHDFNFTISNQLDKMDLEKAGDFLASQLEKYLNEEIK